MSQSPIRTLTRCALCTALLCLCGWIHIPLPGVSVTMQTFGIFLTLFLLGGARGTWTVSAYLLLGCAGLPVFTGFQGGIGILLGPTGGYLLGFLVSALVYWICETRISRTVSAILALLGCYLCGTAWYYFGYLASSGSLLPVLAQCVFPFLLPDALKLSAAWSLSLRLRHLRI